STSATMVAPASSQRGRPAGNSPETTHSLKGSVGTGYASTYPQACCTNARSSSVVPGVIRSTIEVAKSTWELIQSPRVSSNSAAKSWTTVFVTAPFSGRLSQDRTVSADAPEVRRATNPATSLAGSEATGFLGSDRMASRSATMTSRPASRCPSTPRRYAASVTVMVTTATSGWLTQPRDASCSAAAYHP